MRGIGADGQNLIMQTVTGISFAVKCFLDSWRLTATGADRSCARDGEDETEFVVINFFDSLEAVMRFAGPDYTVPVFEPEAKAFLSRIEDFAAHYEVLTSTVPALAAERIRAAAGQAQGDPFN